MIVRDELWQAVLAECPGDHDAASALARLRSVTNGM